MAAIGGAGAGAGAGNGITAEIDRLWMEKAYPRLEGLDDTEQFKEITDKHNYRGWFFEQLLEYHDLTLPRLNRAAYNSTTRTYSDNAYAEFEGLIKGSRSVYYPLSNALTFIRDLYTFSADDKRSSSEMQLIFDPTEIENIKRVMLEILNKEYHPQHAGGRRHRRGRGRGSTHRRGRGSTHRRGRGSTHRRSMRR
jgi:hypothetical protein